MNTILSIYLHCCNILHNPNNALRESFAPLVELHLQVADQKWHSLRVPVCLFESGQENTCLRVSMFNSL